MGRQEGDAEAAHSLDDMEGQEGDAEAVRSLDNIGRWEEDAEASWKMLWF